jgi:hypothetical protein
VVLEVELVLAVNDDSASWASPEVEAVQFVLCATASDVTSSPAMGAIPRKVASEATVQMTIRAFLLARIRRRQPGGTAFPRAPDATPRPPSRSSIVPSIPGALNVLCPGASAARAP